MTANFSGAARALKLMPMGAHTAIIRPWGMWCSEGTDMPRAWMMPFWVLEKPMPLMAAP